MSKGPGNGAFLLFGLTISALSDPGVGAGARARFRLAARGSSGARAAPEAQRCGSEFDVHVLDDGSQIQPSNQGTLLGCSAGSQVSFTSFFVRGAGRTYDLRAAMSGTPPAREAVARSFTKIG
jgi:hypothetical protein